MKLLATEPTADFAVWNYREPASCITAAEAEFTIRSIPALLQSLSERLAVQPGRVLRSLTDTARELCGADAAGICLERDGELIPAETLPILLASGSCESLSGVEVPRAQSACAIALADNRAKLFQVPTSWLPVDQTAHSLAHGITAPWSSGRLRGTLWILKHSDSDPFSVARYRTLLTLANLAGSAFLHLAERELWQQEIYSSTTEALVDTLVQHVQTPLQQLRRELEQSLRRNRNFHDDLSLQKVARELQSMSERIDLLLCTPAQSF